MQECVEIDESVRQLIAEGPYEVPAWQSLLHWLRQTADVDYAGIFIRLPNRPRYSTFHSFSLREADPELEAILARHELINDPMPTFEMTPGRIYALKELLDFTQESHRDFWKDFLEPSGMRFTRNMRIQETSGSSAWISLTNREMIQNDATDRILHAISAPFSRSLRNFIALENERFRATIADTAIERMNFAWATLNSDADVINAGQRTIEVLNRHKGVKLSADGKLLFANSETGKELRSILKHLSQESATGPRALRIESDPWLDMLLVPARNVIANPSHETVAVVYFRYDRHSSEHRHQQIMELFGLLPSEARLTLALAKGLSIAEAATELGITEGTARSYSKQIYSKLGVRGQVDLVRLVLTSVLALA